MFYILQLYEKENNKPQRQPRVPSICKCSKLKGIQGLPVIVSVISSFTNRNNSYHFHHKNKKTIVQIAFLSHTLNQASVCVLLVCLWREPPVLCDSRLLLLHTSYCHHQRESANTHTHSNPHTGKPLCCPWKLDKMGLVLQILCCDRIMQLIDNHSSHRM